LDAEGVEAPELFAPAAEIVGDLFGVVEADHVPGEGDVALEDEINGEGGDGVSGQVLDAPVFPVAVGDKNAGVFAGGVEGVINCGAHAESGEGLDEEGVRTVALWAVAADDMRLQTEGGGASA